MNPITGLHAALDHVLSFAKLANNREVGWLSLDRKTGELLREQQPIFKKIKLLLLFNPVMEWLDTTHAFRLWTHRRTLEAGRKEGELESAQQIRGFVDFYHIDMNDFEPASLDAYPTFEDFFIRRHTPESRPIHDLHNSRKAIVVADARVVTYASVPEAQTLWIKGTDFSITNLVMDSQLGPQFAGGAVASFRLSPQDYHRYHSPVTGTIRLFRSMPGDYYQVDPVALASRVDILTRNARDYLVIDTEDFGAVLFVAIGATDVGSVQIHEKWQRPGAQVHKGDELGLFQFGGSSILVAFQAGRIQFDDDLLKWSRERIQVAVEVGMSLGTAADSKHSTTHVHKESETVPAGDSSTEGDEPFSAPAEEGQKEDGRPHEINQMAGHHVPVEASISKSEHEDGNAEKTARGMGLFDTVKDPKED